jgi:phenylacetate-CoA ligase
MRRTIEQAFGCPVAVEYGSRDGGFIAHQCPAGGLHVHADRVIVEIVRGDRVAEPGEMGEVVLTSLDATAMPFIRYRTGDVAAWSDRPCVCGRRLPTLASIEGRASDFLLARDMRLIHGESITHIVREIDGIAAFRVIQEEVDRLELQVVSLRPEELPRERIESKIQKLFGYPVTVRFTLLQALPRLASGKHRVVVSNLTGRYFEQAGAPA